jgi:hypothetical protein
LISQSTALRQPRPVGRRVGATTDAQVLHSIGVIVRTQAIRALRSVSVILAKRRHLVLYRRDRLDVSRYRFEIARGQNLVGRIRHLMRDQHTVRPYAFGQKFLDVIDVSGANAGLDILRDVGAAHRVGRLVPYLRSA